MKLDEGGAKMQDVCQGLLGWGVLLEIGHGRLLCESHRILHAPRGTQTRIRCVRKRVGEEEREIEIERERERE